MKLERIIRHCNLPTPCYSVEKSWISKERRKKVYLPNDGQANTFLAVTFLLALQLL